MKSIIRLLVIGAAVIVAASVSYVRLSAAAEPASSDGALGRTTGKVVATMDADVYTYVQIDDGSKQIWVAALRFAVSVGDEVIVPDGIAMHDFHSKTLNRTFDVVYFASSIQVAGRESAKEPLSAHAAPPQDMSPHGMSLHTAAGPTAVDLSNIKPADGGQTVAELFADKAALAGKSVVVRGRVVKYIAGVMGKNWLHVRDGSGAVGTNDLAVSTNATTTVGDLVLVRGKLSTNRDYGFGYRYEVIIEDASVVVEE